MFIDRSGENKRGTTEKQKSGEEEKSVVFIICLLAFCHRFHRLPRKNQGVKGLLPAVLCTGIVFETYLSLISRYVVSPSIAAFVSQRTKFQRLVIILFLVASIAVAGMQVFEQKESSALGRATIYRVIL